MNNTENHCKCSGRYNIWAECSRL
ncbi:hypothetical protein [Flavobacterium sp. CFBP9031]